MTYAQLIAFINLWIKTNGNNEITADVLNPVLKAIAERSHDVTGNLENLATTDQTNLVAAINEVMGMVGQVGVRLYTGVDNPNITPPPSFAYADFYMQVSGLNAPILLYQYDGFQWVTSQDLYIRGYATEGDLESSRGNPVENMFAFIENDGIIESIAFYNGSDWVYTPIGGGGAGFDSLQAMYDDDPEKLDVTDGSSTARIRPRFFDIETALEEDETASIGISETSSGASAANVITRTESGYDAYVKAENGSGNGVHLRGFGQVEIVSNGANASILRSDNLTSTRSHQTPNSDGTIANGVKIGATNYPADNEGKIDLTAAIPSPITIDAVPTDGSTNAVSSNGVYDSIETNKFTDEKAQDAVGTILTDSSTIDFTYDDGAPSITAIVKDNSITDAKVASGIAATKIGNGDVDNTELSYLNGVTSAIQTQINNISTGVSPKMFKVASGDVVTYFGDSYTAGSGATSSAFGFSRLTVERMGIVQQDYGFSGGGILKAFNSVNTVSAYRATTKNKVKSIVMVGFNDHIRGGADARELAKIENGYNALFASMFAETAIAANSGSITQSGTWTPLTPGSSYPAKATSLSGQPLSNTTNGDKLTYTLTGTTLIVGYITNDATATGVTFSNFDVVVDGVTLANVNTNNKSLAVTDSYYTNQYAPGAVVFKNLAAGSHTVEIVNKSNNLLYIDWIGTLMAPNNSPDVMVCSIPLINSAGYATQPTYSPSAATSAQADNAIRAAMSNFAEYPLIWNDINTGFASGDVGGDLIHYNNTGHARLANNVMSKAANNAYEPYITSFNERSEPTVLTGSNFKLVGGTPAQIRSGITSEGILFDTSAANTLAGLIYHAATNGAVTQYLKWTKTGNFGIGTAADPSAKFEVNGTTKFTGDMDLTGNITRDVTVAKSVPKMVLNNNIATISTGWSLIGNNAYARNLFKPETATKVLGAFFCPNGNPTAINNYKSVLGVFGTDYGASQTNYSGIFFQAGTAGVGSGFNTVNGGTGVLQPIDFMVNNTVYMSLDTSGNVLITNSPTAASHAVRKDYVDRGVVVTAAATYSMPSALPTYVISGNGTTSTWTAPPIANASGKLYIMTNRGSGNITINSNGGGNDFFVVGTGLTNTFTLMPQQSVDFIGDGSVIIVR